MKRLSESGELTVDLADAFDASPNPYMLLTPELRYAGMNRAYLDVTQRTRDELLGAHVMDAFDGGGDTVNASRLRASFDKVLATGEIDHLPVLHYAIPLPGEDGEIRYADRYWSCTHSPIKDADGRLIFILQHTSDITELHNLRRTAARITDDPADAMLSGRVLARAETVQQDNRRLEDQRNRLLGMFMQAPGFIALLNGPDHVFEMHNAAYAQLIGHRDISGKPVREALPELEGQGYYDFLDTVFATGEPYQGRASRVELQRRPDASLETVYLDFMYQPIRDTTGAVTGIFVQGHDVTNDVLAADRQKLMIDELNHRVKNTLATVQSIAMQTARSHADPLTFAESFQARLMALSHTHDLLTRSHWEGAGLLEILQHETEAHGPVRISLNGPRVDLEPAAALSLGMIFHELATNAAKYGALTAPDGRVMVDWSVDEASTLRLVWRELGGPAVAPPRRRGFGSRLIERNIRHDLAGEVELDYAETGLVADFVIPLERTIAA